MTIREALQILKPFKDCMIDQHGCPISDAAIALDVVIKELENKEWIPCSERLPGIGQKVLASTKKTVFTQVFKGYYSDPKRWAWENNRIKRIEAWQPLPMPWEGEEDEADKSQSE